MVIKQREGAGAASRTPGRQAASARSCCRAGSVSDTCRSDPSRLRQPPRLPTPSQDRPSRSAQLSPYKLPRPRADGFHLQACPQEDLLAGDVGLEEAHGMACGGRGSSPQGLGWRVEDG